MVTRRVRADGSVELIAPGARALITRLSPGVLLLLQNGQNDEVTLSLFGELSAEIRQAGSLTVFADARTTKRMPPEVRDKAIAWAKEHRPHLRTTTRADIQRFVNRYVRNQPHVGVALLSADAQTASRLTTADLIGRSTP